MLPSVLPRRALIEVIYDGRDITQAVSNSVIEFEYIDNASGEADSIELSLQDRDGNWHNEWYPQSASGGGQW